MNKKLVFDIMVGDRFIATERMPITLDIVAGYNGDEPIYDYDKIVEWVLKRRPSLKREKFELYFAKTC